MFDYFPGAGNKPLSSKALLVVVSAGFKEFNGIHT